MKVTIYSPHNSRADYIFYQYNSIRKHVKDADVEYIVINDAKPHADLTNMMNEKAREQIRSLCTTLGIQCIEFPSELHENRRILFPKTSEPRPVNYSCACADVFQFAVNQSADKEGIVMLVDSDMFFYRDINLEDHLRAITLSFTPSTRQGITYMWNGIVFYKPRDIPDVRQMNFDPGNLPGNPLDAGGMTHEYLQKYENRLSIRYVVESMETFQVSTPENISLERYPLLFQQDALVNTICSLPPPTETTISWHVYDKFLVHYGQGGNWNGKGFYDHAIKTRAFLEFFGESLF